MSDGDTECCCGEHESPSFTNEVEKDVLASSKKALATPIEGIEKPASTTTMTTTASSQDASVSSTSSESVSSKDGCDGSQQDDDDDNDDDDDAILLEGRKKLVQQQGPWTRRGSSALKAELQRRLGKSLEVTSEFTKTPTGFASVLGVSSAVAAVGVFQHEVQLQRQLTQTPSVFGQVLLDPAQTDGETDQPLMDIYQELTKTSDSILSRPIEPSLFVGTRPWLASGAAMVLGKPSPPCPIKHLCFRETIQMKADGTQIALDWELSNIPHPSTSRQKDSSTTNLPMLELKRRIMAHQKDCIHKPVVLIKHGINNDSTVAYMQSIMRACTDKGWIAVCMNFRGCGGVPLATPRGYNGTYTGDLRSVIYTLSHRLAGGVPLFLVGNSLGANLVTKYLGEEGLSDSLPACVMGGVALGNPLEIHSEDLITAPWKQLLAMGIKQHLVEHWKDLYPMVTMNRDLRQRFWNLWWAPTIGQVDQVCAPLTHHNDLVYPFAMKVGYENSKAFWTDSSSYQTIQHVSVPLLQVVASDDMIVYDSFQKRLAHCLLNPNVMCVETKCGGHLGWQEKSPPKTDPGQTNNKHHNTPTSWAGRAATDFIEAILKTRTTPNKYHPKNNANNNSTNRSSPASNTIQTKVNEAMSFRNSKGNPLTGMPGVDREIFGIRSRL